MKRKIFFLTTFIILIGSFTFSEESLEYRISITNNLNLREKPDINSKNVMVTISGEKVKGQLHITQSVKVLQVDKNEVILNGNKGRWILVDSGFYDYLTNKPMIGWVFDYYLAKKEDFHPLATLPNNLELIFDHGDALIHFKFFKDGSVHFITEEKTEKGTLFIDNKNKIVIVKYDDQKELLLWSDSFIYLDGKICEYSIELDKTCSKVVK